ncbi:MAG TPA: glucose-6-phosphate isomerase family protein [Terriglobales bacterium]|nr:glucose-6-phosphate isomerase family protein [Terriglobales bacterium]
MSPARDKSSMKFDPKLSVRSHHDLSFSYDEGVFGPQPELRRLDQIRRSLRNPNCDGPDPVYSIVMDVGRREHTDELARRMLLFGVVVYAAGQLGDEPVRSQGHIHAVAPHCGWSTPELFEIWEGRAFIYAQESADDDPGRCFAITAGPGDKVVVPPGWAHAVINADPNTRMMFGAWCDRQYGFVYDAVRAHHGLAWFPILDGEENDGRQRIRWERNPSYRSYPSSELAIRGPRAYPELGLDPSTPIYEQFAKNPDSVQWVSEPSRAASVWPNFEM